MPREAGAFIAEHNTAAGGKLPLNTNGGGLFYMHSGMYGMYALQESVRQMRGTAWAQIPDARISVCHVVGGMFAASGTIIMSNQVPSAAVASRLTRSSRGESRTCRDFWFLSIEVQRAVQAEPALGQSRHRRS